MSVSYAFGQRQKYRITLEVETLDDFNPHQIDWRKMLLLEGNESCESYIEDLSLNVDQDWV